MSGKLIHRHIDVNGVRLHIAEQGEGPLVLLLHGWPESWYSWRHQFEPLAAAGYRVVAPDQRGYARSEQPADVTAYTMLHLVGDVVALIRELGEERAILVGHDMGAPVAWVTAMLRPDVVSGVAGLSVPPVLPTGLVPPSITRTLYGERFYQIYFQQPGVVDAEFAKDIASSFRRVLYGASGDNPRAQQPRPWVIPEGMTPLDTMPEPPALPAWLTEDDIRAYAEDFALHGADAFTGAFNWYRNIERNHELLAAFQGRGIDVPALYVVGDRDMVTALRGPGGVRADVGKVAPRLHAQLTLPGCGHWTQQERPAEVNAALLDFFAHLDSGATR
ncbi:alpha/beta fold hydrolase [Streptomyces diastatochromogenes]|uniref:Epoxide hydrolase n=1 Tax=Streptomyces diastatochromogenes TaxID=42236 RepID=A0A233SAZ1_STRDA|nr:alpha/beta hydrolase [Streptomyces diastatochromogenes]MCZ0985357.1 alpha/beta hydrolase [Streptomyces diastatochromogenes]OXY92845.1 epoxide hydrolase [Streptomyces diastatochromogenes]